VNYNYSLKSGYDNLTVTLDGNAISANGTITMTQDHTLNATSTRVDFSGNWKVSMKWDATVIGMPGWNHNFKDIDNVSAKFTHDGNNLTVEFDTSNSGIHNDTLKATGKIDTAGKFTLDTTIEWTSHNATITQEINIKGTITNGNKFRNAIMTNKLKVVGGGQTMTGTLKGTMDGDKQ
jgi:hypothetical protein